MRNTFTTGTANLGFHFNDATSVRGIYREFDSYSGNPGQVYYGLRRSSTHWSGCAILRWAFAWMTLVDIVMCSAPWWATIASATNAG